jgi:hypothetical protein
MKEKIIRFVKKYRAPLTGLVILIVIYTGTSIYDYPLHKHGIYSVATITDVIAPGARVGRSSDFYFYYQEKKYEATAVTRDLITRQDIGRRFYIKFLKDNPNRCYILSNKPVPDCIKEVPPEGWTEIPHCSYRDEKVTP